MARKEKKGRDGGEDIGDFDLSSMYGPFHVEWKEDWTDYEAIMKERPDLYAYDRRRKKWRLTKKGEESDDAHIILWKQRRFERFPEDRAGGELDLTAEEYAARGFPLL